MGPAKHSRKGKKSWRKNIDATEEQEHIQQTTYEERRGPAVSTLADDQLFTIDKSADEVAAAAVAVGKKKKKREKKPLRSELIINAAHLATPVIKPVVHKKKGKLLPPPSARKPAEAPKPKPAPKPEGEEAVADPWDVAAAAAGAAGGDAAEEGRSRKRRKGSAGPIKAVEVDLPGCSINPDHEHHQDAMAALVAQEMKKELQKELAPKAPPLLAPADYTPQDELTRLLTVDVDQGDGEEEEAEQEEAEGAGAGARGGQGASTSGVGQGGQQAGGAARGLDRKTKKDRNKELRRKEAEKELQQRAVLKRQRQELANLGPLQRQLAEEEAEKEARRLRREVVKAEKAAAQPPRLGKLRFQPGAVQALTSDEITGSLRQVPACFTVTRDRFKSLQKRGLIEPRKPRGPKVLRKRIEFQTGDRAEKAAARQAELQDLRKRRVAAAKALQQQGA